MTDDERLQRLQQLKNSLLLAMRAMEACLQRLPQPQQPKPNTPPRDRHLHDHVRGDWDAD